MQRILISLIPLLLCSCLSSNRNAIERVSFHSFSSKEIFVSDVYFDGEKVRVPVGHLAPNSSSTTHSFFSNFPQTVRVNYQVDEVEFVDDIDFRDFNELVAKTKSNKMTLYMIYTEGGDFIPKLHLDVKGDYRGVQGELHPDQELEEYKSYKRLLRAVSSDDYELLKAEVDSGAPVYWLNEPVSNSPIEWAALNGNLDSLNLILSEGTQYPSFIIANCLKLAAQNGYTDILRVLLERQYTEGINNQNLQTILYSTVSLNTNSNSKAIMMLLQYFDLPIDFKIRDSGHTLLIVASQSDKTEIVRFLVEQGADTDLMTNYGSTAIDFTHKEDIRKILKENKHNKSLDDQ